MSTLNISAKINWLRLVILFPALWATTCGGISTAQNLWDGEAKGYVVQGSPESDDVAFLVHLGHVQAAVGRVSSYDKEEGMANPFTAELMAEYAMLDTVISGFERADLSLQPLLSEMAAPETFNTIMSQDRSKRTEQNAIQTQLRNLTLRVDAVVTEKFPSVRASALAMSALFREAGEELRTGLSNDGQILDVAKHRDALQLMDASFRLRVNKVSACARNTEAIDQLKSRGPLGDLLDRFIIVSPAGAVGGNAGDAFDAAEKLEQLGLSLPIDDAQICQ